MDPEKALIAKVEGQIREVMADIHAMMAPDSGVPLSRAMRLMQVYVEPMRTIAIAAIHSMPKSSHRRRISSSQCFGGTMTPAELNRNSEMSAAGRPEVAPAPWVAASDIPRLETPQNHEEKR